eukprot:CAMPEP_0179073868 /NCGR_PEP_ID=MMETSP0796-20121207/32794_1 /TAXON_ID=73915 /ORGANISM="Pyrodinium bahamense, Strain pbaha01" /LENGTH=286 /DNA_ID=CAMNT_0020771077 /DNA_START=151 /DNA_END=1012 /DNA_ORIENTATION=-
MRLKRLFLVFLVPIISRVCFWDDVGTKKKQRREAEGKGKCWHSRWRKVVGNCALEERRDDCADEAPQHSRRCCIAEDAGANTCSGERRIEAEEAAVQESAVEAQERTHPCANGRSHEEQCARKRRADGKTDDHEDGSSGVVCKVDLRDAPQGGDEEGRQLVLAGAICRFAQARCDVGLFQKVWLEQPAHFPAGIGESTAKEPKCADVEWQCQPWQAVRLEPLPKRNCHNAAHHAKYNTNHCNQSDVAVKIITMEEHRDRSTREDAIKSEKAAGASIIAFEDHSCGR